MKATVNKLYSFIAKLVSMLEEELDELKVSKSKSAINIKKNITDTLNKLVHLIIQLNKLSKDEAMNNNIDMTQEDKDIIERFINRYKQGPLPEVILNTNPPSLSLTQDPGLQTRHAELDSASRATE